MYKIEVPEEHLLNWLEDLPVYPKFYWQGKDSQIQRVALGCRAHFSKIPEDLPIDSRLYGGCFFSKDCIKTPIWDSFFPNYFFLPKWEIEQEGSVATLFAHAPIEEIRSLWDKLPSVKCHPDWEKRRDTPSKSAWIQNIINSQNQMRENSLQKVVLARESQFTSRNQLPSFAWLQIHRKNPQRGTLFAFQMSPQATFLGNTPEHLFSRKGTLLRTEAIAGTRPRGKTDEEEAIFAKELLESKKETKEFLYVKNYLQERLSSLCESDVLSTEASLIKTQNLQHLHSIFTANLLSSSNDQAILSTLHPTPALGGTPKEKALFLINRLESFDRGLYGGPIGWTSKEESCFAVAIRSALVRSNSMHLFAGAGIVQDSDPEKEWEELEQKIRLWTDLWTT